MRRDQPQPVRLLARKPPELDRLIDEWVLGTSAVVPQMPLSRRLLRDAIHFGISLTSEMSSLFAAAPAFVGELAREGAYPKRMSWRKLPFRPEMADLTVLRAANPDWVFRADFAPHRWIFVFLHGYVDNTGADRVAFKLAGLGYQVYLVRYPFLRGVESLAGELRAVLREIAALEPDKRIVPMGHSLGGCIWDDLLMRDPSVVKEHDIPLYIPLGSPHYGTLAAHLGVGRSAADMHPHSTLVAEHLRMSFPAGLEIYPFVSRFDLLVLPIETALLRRGINYVLSETGHIGQVIRSAIVTAIEEIIASPPEALEERAVLRPFYPSTLALALARLPRRAQRQLGVDGILAYIHGDGGEVPKFRLRIVRHEIGLGIFPALRRPGGPRRLS